MKDTSVSQLESTEELISYLPSGRSSVSSWIFVILCLFDYANNALVTTCLRTSHMYVAVNHGYRFLLHCCNLYKNKS